MIKELPLITILLSVVFNGCIKKYEYESDKGCREPIYLSYDDLRSKYPAIKEPREIKKAGKIYVYGDTLLVNEKNIGIHVIDNRVKESPQAKKFIEIPGNIDLAVKDGYLYADSFTDLVVIDIRDIKNIAVVKNARKESIFPYDYLQSLTQEDLDKDNKCYGYDDGKSVIVGYR